MSISIVSNQSRFVGGSEQRAPSPGDMVLSQSSGIPGSFSMGRPLIRHAQAGSYPIQVGC